MIRMPWRRASPALTGGRLRLHASPRALRLGGTSARTAPQPATAARATASALAAAAAPWIALRARLCIFRWIHLKIDGDSQFSRRRRTFALGQDSTQQPQTAMSRPANVEAFKGRERVVRTLPGSIASALALRNHPEGSSAPADRGGKLYKAIRSEGLCCDAQPKRAPG